MVDAHPAEPGFGGTVNKHFENTVPVLVGELAKDGMRPCGQLADHKFTDR
jgi:hypothetical protein